MGEGLLEGFLKKLDRKGSRIKGSSLPPESKELDSPYGYIQIGGEQIGIRNSFINAGSVHGSVQGEISSNVSGIIAAVHGSIRLTIKSPTKEAEPPTKKGRQAYQTIGDKPASDIKGIHFLGRGLFRTYEELHNITGQLEQLNQQLMRLNQNEGNGAKELITEAVKRRGSLEKSAEFYTEQLKTERVKTTPIPNMLRVRAVHEDITIKVEDPGVEIVIRENLHRNPPQIKGVAPENPRRTIELYLIHGIAHIEYPPVESN